VHERQRSDPTRVTALTLRAILNGGLGVIPVAELDKLAQARLDDAQALLAANRYDGATYLCGYAVEMALKARTCRVLSTRKADAEAMVQATEKLLPIL